MGIVVEKKMLLTFGSVDRLRFCPNESNRLFILNKQVINMMF